MAIIWYCHSVLQKEKAALQIFNAADCGTDVLFGKCMLMETDFLSGLSSVEMVMLLGKRK